LSTELSIHPTPRIDVDFCTQQPAEPFSAVRLAMFYLCRCPQEWLQGGETLHMMHRLKELSEESGFTVIGGHHDLYGKKWIELRSNGWTINLSYAQSGASFDAWHIPRTVDINLHWCHEEGDLSVLSPNHEIEKRLFDLLEKFFQPTLAVYNPRVYRVLALPEEQLKRLLALASKTE